MPEGTEMREQSCDIKNVSESALSPDTCLLSLLAVQQRIKMVLIFYTVLEGLKDVHMAIDGSVAGGTWMYLRRLEAASKILVRISCCVQIKCRHFSMQVIVSSPTF